MCLFSFRKLFVTYSCCFFVFFRNGERDEKEENLKGGQREDAGSTKYDNNIEPFCIGNSTVYCGITC